MATTSYHHLVDENDLNAFLQELHATRVLYSMILEHKLDGSFLAIVTIYDEEDLRCKEEEE